MKLYKYLKAEIDVEFMACTHGMVLMISYGILRWMIGIKEVPFAVMFQMIMLCYVIALVQKILFFGDKQFPKNKYRIRLGIWYLIPFILTLLCDALFQWFTKEQFVIHLIFYSFEAFYFVMLWLFVKFLYQEDTDELNKLLQARKRRKSH